MTKKPIFILLAAFCFIGQSFAQMGPISGNIKQIYESPN